jgi:CHAT domain-containing protein
LILVCCAKALYAQQGNHADALFATGQQLYDEGKYQTAADSLDKAATLFEFQKDLAGHVKSLNLFGECMANMNRCEKAVEILNRSVEISINNFKPQSSEVAYSYYYLARALGGCSRKHAEAISLLHKTIRLKRNLFGEGNEVAFDYTFIGYIFNSAAQYDSAFFYLDKAIKIRRKNLPSDDIEISTTLHYLGSYHENKSDLSKALDFHLQSLKIRTAKLNSLHVNISNSLHQIGSVYQKLGNFDRALEYFQKALAIREMALGKSHANVAASYITIGTLYGSMFNYRQAIHYIKQGNTILENVYGNKSDILPTYDAYLGRMYGQINEHENATKYLKKAQAEAEKNLGPKHLYLGIVYAFVGDYHADHKATQLAETYFKKAVFIFREASGINSVREADVLSKIASIHSKNKNYRDARSMYSQALTIYRNKLGNQNPKVSSVYLSMGDVNQEESKFDMALTNYQKALASMSTGFMDTLNFSANPTLAQLDNKPLALRVVGNKAMAFVNLSGASVENLKHAHVMYQFAIDLIGDIASGYNLESARIELEKESRSTFNKAMHVAHSLYEKTKDEKYKQAAFSISEKSKSAMLLENIRDSQAKFLAGVPDSLVGQERDFKIELAYYQSALHRAESKKDTASIHVQEKNIFQAQEQFTKLKKRLEGNFPSYFNFKYKATKPSVEKIMPSLEKDGAAMIEFYVDDSVIYTFTISKNVIALDKIKKDERLIKLMNEYEKCLTDVDFILNSRDEADRLYTSSAHALYEILLRPTFKNIDASVTKLIIIPDDRLAQFSFGTLLRTKPSGTNPDYKNLDYLSKQFQISYVYSSALMAEAFKRKKPNYSFAGFAPTYKGNQFANIDSLAHPMAQLVVRSGNLPLAGAAEEVKSISQLMDGDSFINQEATETNFKLHAGNYGVLHLAMHSLLNNEDPNYSELLFNHENDLGNDGYLHVSEIYNLQLNAAMVVLSACSSGYGKIQQGEGPISLSRAFSYAGCPSVVMSLWKIPDEVTNQVMTNFYMELKKGKQKDEALKLAQLKFLSGTNDPLYHHPYFWAGFVVMGDASPLPGKSFMWIVYSGLVIVSITIVLFIRKKRSASTTQAV